MVPAAQDLYPRLMLRFPNRAVQESKPQLLGLAATFHIDIPSGDRHLSWPATSAMVWHQRLAARQVWMSTSRCRGSPPRPPALRL